MTIIMVKQRLTCKKFETLSLNTSHGVINYMKFLSKCVADQNE